MNLKEMRARLPYGKWACADGREVLFNRDFKPIWQKLPDAESGAFRVEPADPEAESDAFRVRWTSQEWFYDDAIPPAQRLEIGRSVLAEWGVPS